MTDEERDTVAWVQSLSPQHHYPILKAMLARPLLPAEMDDDLARAIWSAVSDGVKGGSYRVIAERVLFAIRKHVTPSKPKSVRVTGGDGFQVVLVKPIKVEDEP